jgi:fucose 4-O-acetylase-like acetyltransferase
MNSKALIFLLVFVAGMVVLLLPDSGNRVFEFNKDHGPSPLDLAGLTMILIAWIFSCVLIINNKHKITSKLGKRTTFLLVLIYLISATGIASGLLLSSDPLLWSAVIAAVAINILLIVFALKPGNG